MMWGIELRGLEKSNRKASANAVQRVHVDYFPGFLPRMEERTRRVGVFAVSGTRSKL